MAFDREMNKNTRIQVMDEYGYSETERYMDMFRAAYLDKENLGVTALMQRANNYWEGWQNIPDSDDAPGSNLNIVNPQIETFVAMIADKDISIECLGREPGDHAYAEYVENMLQFVADNNYMGVILDDFARKLGKYGTAVMKVMYDPDWNKGFGMPRIYTPTGAYIYVDPSVTNPALVDDMASYIIEVERRSKYWARTQKHFDQEAVECITTGYDQDFFQYLFGESRSTQWVLEAGEYLHMYVWTKVRAKVKQRTVNEYEEENPETGVIERVKEVEEYTGEDPDGEWTLRLVEMSMDGYILSDSFETGETFPANKYPYFFTNLMRRDGSIWAKGIAELLFDPQDLINDLDDQIRQAARLTGNPQKLVSVDSNVDVDKITNESGLIIPTNNIMGIKNLDPPEFPRYITERRNSMLKEEIPLATRISYQMSGQRQKGVDTATEALQLQQSGMANIDHAKALMQITLAQVFEYILQLCMERWDGERVFRITGEDAPEYMFFNPGQLKKVPIMKPATPEYQSQMRNAMMDELSQRFSGQPINASMLASAPMPKYEPLSDGATKEAEFDVVINIGAGLPKDKGFMYTLIKELGQGGLIGPRQYRKMIEKYTGLIIPDEEADEMAAVQQQKQGMQNLSKNATVGGLPSV